MNIIVRLMQYYRKKYPRKTRIKKRTQALSLPVLTFTIHNSRFMPTFLSDFLLKSIFLMSSNAVDLIAKINDALGRSRDVQSNIRAAIEMIRDEFSVEFVFVVLDQPENEGLAVTNAVGIGPSDFRKLESRIQQSFLNSDIEKAEPAFHKSISETELSFLGDISLFTAPLKLGELNLGIAAAGFQKNFPDAANVLSIFPLVASMIAQTLRIERAVRGQRQKLIDENSHLRQELKGKYDFSHIVGNSGPMKQVYELVTQVAKSNATVLLRGETGTGKEMIANAIH